MTIDRNQAEWTAVFLTAAELTRRGHRVSFTLGQNAPLADLVVRAPSGKTFIVDGKGKCRPGRWVVKPKAATSDLYYVLVRMGMCSTGLARDQDRFYVMDQSSASALIRVNATHPGLSGFSSNAAGEYLDAWDRLAGRVAGPDLRQRADLVVQRSQSSSLRGCGRSLKLTGLQPTTWRSSTWCSRG